MLELESFLDHDHLGLREVRKSFTLIVEFGNVFLAFKQVEKLREGCLEFGSEEFVKVSHYIA